MPMYDYFCSKCLIEFEVFVKDRDAAVLCPKCETELKRLPAAPSFYIH